ncbi:MAG: TetR/AcrR family transcriptional regulator [Syntrophomonadaceae bacterium]
MKDSTQKSAHKRQLIIEAAVQVFSREGYHNARMEEIAAAAGIGKGTIYEYFDSKLQLFQEMLEGSLRLYYDRLTPEEIDRLTFVERLRWLLEGHYKFCLENRKLAKVTFWDQEIFDKELKEWAFKRRRDFGARLQAIIEEGISRKEIKAMDVKLATVVISGILGSIWVPVILDGWTMDPGQLADQVTAMIMYGFKN